MRSPQAETPAADAAPYAVGSYVTCDGALLGIVGALPQEPSLRLVEDCRTLEIMVLSVSDLRAAGVQQVVR